MVSRSIPTTFSRSIPTSGLCVGRYDWHLLDRAEGIMRACPSACPRVNVAPWHSQQRSTHPTCCHASKKARSAGRTARRIGSRLPHWITAAPLDHGRPIGSRPPHWVTAACGSELGCASATADESCVSILELGLRADRDHCSALRTGLGFGCARAQLRTRACGIYD